MDRGAWQATAHGVEKNQTQLSPQAQNHVVYSKGKMPENVISCDIRKFLEDNSFIEAVIFV